MLLDEILIGLFVVILADAADEVFGLLGGFDPEFDSVIVKAEGALPLLASAPKMAMDMGVSATTKKGLNCWNCWGRMLISGAMPL